MGTDIHMYVERKLTDIGKWKYTPMDVWEDRNYDVFAMLANVRNGHGFAGVPTSSGFEILAEPRGMPVDASEHVRTERSWDHTPSWLLLKEILDAERHGYFDKVSTHVGVIPLVGEVSPFPWRSISYVSWLASGRGKPASASSSVFGKNVITVDEDEAQRLIAKGYVGPTPESPTVYYVAISWTSTYRDSAKRFLAWIHDSVCPLGQDVGEHRVRLVFGFDS